MAFTFWIGSIVGVTDEMGFTFCIGSIAGVTIDVGVTGWIGSVTGVSLIGCILAIALVASVFIPSEVV